MTLVFLLILVYSGLFIWLTLRWRMIPYQRYYSHTEGVTILIPVRNEAKNIRGLLEAINHQKFDLEKLEVIVIDDHSEDDTIQEVTLAAMHARYRLKCLQLANDQFGKKWASTMGVEYASHDIILCTDGDILPGVSWVKTMTAPLTSGKLMMVSGPVSMTGRSFIERIQQIEFSGLIGIGAITLDLSKPTMCNGANMAYRKEAFKKVNGYMNNLHIPSGDDEFLLQKIHKQYPGKAAFVKSKSAVVKTPTKATAGQLWNQRVRWTGKWRHHNNLFISSLAILSFLIFVLLSFVPFWALFQSVIFGLLLFTFKFISEYLYVYHLTRFHGIKIRLTDAILLSLIYPVYVVFLGIASIFGRYSWKGRNY